MSRVLKYGAGVIAVILVLYLSLDIQNLEKHKSSDKINFNATDYAAKFWENDIPSSVKNAPQALDLLKILNENPEIAYEKYGHKLGISKTYYFILKGMGTIEKVEDEFLVVALDKNTKIKIATDFIYGNAVRDGSGRVNINDFLNMTDFNKVSVAINKLVKEKVVSRLRKTARAGLGIEFAGAMEISEDTIDYKALLIFPVSAKLTDGKAE